MAAILLRENRVGPSERTHSLRSTSLALPLSGENGCAAIDAKNRLGNTIWWSGLADGARASFPTQISGKEPGLGMGKVQV